MSSCLHNAGVFQYLSLNKWTEANKILFFLSHYGVSCIDRWENSRENSTHFKSKNVENIIFHSWENKSRSFWIAWNSTVSHGPFFFSVYRYCSTVQFAGAWDLAAAYGFLCRDCWKALDLNLTDHWTRIMSWKWLKGAQSHRPEGFFSVVLKAQVVVSPYSAWSRLIQS